MCTCLKNMKGYKLKDLMSKGFDFIQEMFDRAFKRVNTFEDFSTELVEGKEKRIRAELVQESTKKQNVEDDKETTDIKKLMEIIPDEEVAIDAIPLAVKSPSIVDWKIHKEGRKSYYQITRADGKSQMYMIFSHMLKSFDSEDLETLHGCNGDINKDTVLEWKVYDHGCTFLDDATLCIFYMLGRIVRIKSLLDAVRITAAQVYVNTALMKLVLLMRLQRKYAKYLLLLAHS
ncbi:hypothetical protein Tco_0856863 [Tanacetum coccineum]|uniref:Uncharacterized protein n=1 Tax=Tanacetum coccineum TaxID=301880 RepID=A0ABQ5B5C0_9ASTR